MEFVARRRKLKIILDSGEYEISAPSILQIQKLDEALRARQSDIEAIDIYADFLSSLGLPREALLSLDGQLFTELVSFVTKPQEKKS